MTYHKNSTNPDAASDSPPGYSLWMVVIVTLLIAAAIAAAYIAFLWEPGGIT